MKAIYKLVIEHKIQTQFVYVKASGVKQAIDYVARMHKGAKVEFVQLEDNNHFFDIEL